MKQLFLRLSFLLLLTPIITQVFSQENAKIKLNVISKKESTVLHNGVYYMLPDEDLGLSLSFNESDKINEVKRVYLISKSVANEKKTELDFLFEDGILEFPLIKYAPQEYLLDHSITIDFEYSVIIEDSIVNRYISYNHNEKFNKKTYPEIESITDVEKYQYAGSNIDIEIKSTGGNENGWRFSWPDGVTQSSSYTYTTKSTSAEVNDETFEVNIINYAPDNATIWYTDTARFEIQTYPEPKVQATSETEFKVVNGEKVTMSIEAEGGNKDTWEYKWYLNGTEINGVNGTSHTIEAKGEIYDRNEVYKVVVTNKLDNKVRFEKELSFSITIEGILRWSKTLPQNVLEEDEVTAVAELKDAKNEKWIYTWKLDGKKIDCNEPTCTFIIGKGSDNGKSSKLVLNVATEDGKSSYTIEHTFTVWTKPETAVYSKNDIALLHNQSYQFSINTSGGYRDGWSFEWFVDNEPISGATSNSYTVTASNQTQEVKNSVYKIIATNITYERKTQFEHLFKLETWPEATETHSPEAQDIYYNDEITLEVNVAGGAKNGWEFIWNNNEEELTDNTYTYKADSTTKNYNTETIKLRITNRHEKAVNNGILYEKDITFEIKSWSHGKITTTLMYSTTDYLSNAEIPFIIDTNGGYPNWEFRVYYNNELKDVFNRNDESDYYTYTITSENNYSSTFCIDSIRIEAINSIPSNNRSKRSEDGFSINVWPVISIADEFEVSCTKVGENLYAMREGDSLMLSVDLATGANYTENDKFWKYVWEEDFRIVKESAEDDKKNEYFIEKIEGEYYSGKNSTDKTYGLTISNTSPNNREWYNKRFGYKTVKVYNRPATPESLIVKGNGNSNTLICFTSLNDYNLESKEYEFVFGYTDRNGRDHFMEPTEVRWYQFDSNVSVLDKSYKFWVTAQWTYDYNTAITSGRVFLNSDTIDETFNASYYNGPGSRGETTNIDEVNNVHLSFDGQRVVAESSNATQGTIIIARTDGQIVEKIFLEKSCSFNETIDFTSYPAGIYIINVTIGEERISKKIVIL